MFQSLKDILTQMGFISTVTDSQARVNMGDYNVLLTVKNGKWSVTTDTYVEDCSDSVIALALFFKAISR